MDKVANFPQRAMKYQVEVGLEGRIELQVPLLPGVHVTIFVVEDMDSFGDLAHAAQTSLDFWDNPLDDEDWNDV